jgi:hypothetical protein
LAALKTILNFINALIGKFFPSLRRDAAFVMQALRDAAWPS